MPSEPLDDATARYLEEVATDLHGLLGPGVELADLAIEQDGPDVTLRATYGLADASIVSSGHGASAIEAHAHLRRAIVSDRIGLGFRRLVLR